MILCMLRVSKGPLKNVQLKLTIRVLLGCFLGIFAGIFFGKYALYLHPVGSVFIMLMQSVVYPYIIASLLHGLGSLSPEVAKKLFKKTGLLYLLFIVISISLIWLLSLAIPQSSSAIIGPNVAHPTVANFLQQLIPQNLFAALANNYMPAIIIFCLLFGSALQHYKNNGPILEVLTAVKVSSLKVWNWVVLLSPYASFALMAETVGTLSITMFENIAIYLFLFFLGCLLFTFWLIPMLIGCFIPLRYRDCIRLLREALLIAVATNLAVAALPYIIECVTQLISKRQVSSTDSKEKIAETVSTLSYPFSQIGNLFLYLFIIFSATYFQRPIVLDHVGKFFLMILTYFSSLGSPSSTLEAVSFLANWTALPPQTSDLNVGLLPITRYAQVLASVGGMAFISIVGTFAYFDSLKIKWCALIACLLATFIGLGSLIFTIIHYHLFKMVEQPSLLSFRLDPELIAGTEVLMDPPALSIPQLGSSSTLVRIRQTKILRVGYNEHMIPFVYFNQTMS